MHLKCPWCKKKARHDLELVHMEETVYEYEIVTCINPECSVRPKLRRLANAPKPRVEIWSRYENIGSAVNA